MRERVSRTKVTNNLLMNTQDLIFAETKLQMPFEFSLMKRKVDDKVDKKKQSLLSYAKTCKQLKENLNTVVGATSDQLEKPSDSKK